jgi:hypothetical protein
MIYRFIPAGIRDVVPAEMLAGIKPPSIFTLPETTKTI